MYVICSQSPPICTCAWSRAGPIGLTVAASVRRTCTLALGMEPTLQPLSPRQQTSHGPRGRSPDFDGERVSVPRIVALIAVPALWGSYTPALKMLLDGRNVPPAVVTNLASHVVGFLSLLFLWYLQPGGAKLPEDPAERRRAMHASLELGTYLFFGQLTQLLGLAGTSATTNAVLVQSSVVIIPLLDSAGFESRRWRTPSGFAIRMLPSAPQTRPNARPARGDAGGVFARSEIALPLPLVQALWRSAASLSSLVWARPGPARRARTLRWASPSQWPRQPSTRCTRFASPRTATWTRQCKPWGRWVPCHR